MVITQGRPKRKTTGGKYKTFRNKRMYEIGREPAFTKLAPTKKKSIATKGGNVKTRLLRCDVANVYNPKTKKCEKLKIITVLENPANPHFVRRNIMTKGAIVQTEKGKAKITSRLGQHGIANAVMIE